MLWAAAEGMAVTPVVAGYNVAGIAIPRAASCWTSSASRGSRSTRTR